MSLLTAIHGARGDSIPIEEIATFIANTCLNVQSDEDVLVVCDHAHHEMAAAFAQSLCCTFISIPPLTYNGEEPSVQVSCFFQHFDVIIALTTLSLGPTDARKNACQKGVRFISMAGITEKSLYTVLKTDYALLKKRASLLNPIFEDAQCIEVRNGSHTVTMSAKGRHPLPLTGIYTERGAFGTLPEGEVLISPVETSVNGSFVVDVGMVGLGFFKQPIIFHVEKGKVVSLEGAKKALEPILEAHQGSRQIAEFAIGINPAAQYHTIFEAKKIEGTCHLSIGDNHTIGGIHRCGIHMDGVISTPTISIDGMTVVEGGILKCQR